MKGGSCTFWTPGCRGGRGCPSAVSRPTESSVTAERPGGGQALFTGGQYRVPLEVAEAVAVHRDLGEPFAELARRPPPTAPFDDLNRRPLTQPANERGLP